METKQNQKRNYNGYFFLSLFIYFERDRDSVGGGGTETGRERESQAGSAMSAWSQMWGSNSGNCEIMP